MAKDSDSEKHDDFEETEPGTFKRGKADKQIHEVVDTQPPPEEPPPKDN